MDTAIEDVVSHYVVIHFLLDLRFTVFRTMGPDPSGVPTHVGVLKTAQKDDLAEVAKMTCVRQLVEEGFSGVAFLFHGELGQALNVFELADGPKTYFDQSTYSI